MTQFFNTIKDVSKNYKSYDKWEQAQADKMAKKEYLANKMGISQDKLNKTKEKAEVVIRATEIMDARSENNCENVEQVFGMVSSLPLVGVCLAQVYSLPGIDKVLKSRIQTKIDKLTKEIESAKLSEEALAIKKNEIENLIKSKGKTSTKAMLISTTGAAGASLALIAAMTLWANAQQKLASRIGRFQAKQDELKDVENFISYTPEQIAEANEIAKKIPDKKEKNSFSQAVQELKEMQASRSDYKKWAKEKDPKELENLKSRNVTKEQLEEGKKDQELITNIVSNVNISAEEFSENLENAFDTVGTLSWIASVPIAFGVKKILNKFTYIKPERGNLISSAIGFLVGLTVSMMGTFEQKNASRIGRYKARQDLMKNPHKLMSFSEEEMKLANDVRADKQKKGLFEKIGESFIFLKNYYKQKREYNNYKETTQKQKEKLQIAFKEISVTEQQKAEAKALQKNVFRAFDEVDEMSQRYSEDIEATTEIAKSLFTNIWQFGVAAGIILLPIGVYKGKIPLLKPIKKLSDLAFKKDSSLKLSIDKFYQAVQSKGKKSANEFQQNLFSGNITSYLEKAENAEIKATLIDLKKEFQKINISNASIATLNSEKVAIEDKLEELLKNHFKQSPVAKWARKLTLEGLKLKSRSLFKKGVHAQIEMARKNNIKLSKAEIDKLWEDFYKFEAESGLKVNAKNYKTMLSTAIASVIPGFALLISVPYMFNAWLTDIQKKAGKIGVMKAMQKLDDPKIFVN